MDTTAIEGLEFKDLTRSDPTRAQLFLHDTVPKNLTSCKFLKFLQCEMV